MTSRIVVNNIEPDAGISSVTVDGGLTVTGLLKYEDVKNVDSVGLITARSGIRVTAGDVGINVTPTSNDMGGATPKLHVLGISTDGQFNTVARFQAGGDADSTGAMIAINHSNDRGLAIQGGRISGNYSHGALKMIDFSGRLSDAMVIHGGAGQGINDISFFTGASTTTTKRLVIDSSGRVLIGTPSTSDTAFLVVKGNTTGSGQQGEMLLLNGASPIEQNYGLGQISFGGGTGDQISSKIQGFADHDWNTGGDTSDSPGRIVFFTTPDTGDTPTEKLRISSEGYVTKALHPSFYARRSIAGDGRAAASPVTEWQNPGSEANGNPNHNRGGHFDHSTGLFTAPVSGIYHFSACAGYKQTDQSFNQKFYHNGTTTSEGSRYIGSGVQSHSTSTISATMYMQAGNTMGVAMEYTHHANTTHNFFSGHLVG